MTFIFIYICFFSWTDKVDAKILDWAKQKIDSMNNFSSVKIKSEKAQSMIYWVKWQNKVLEISRVVKDLTPRGPNLRAPPLYNKVSFGLCLMFDFKLFLRMVKLVSNSSSILILFFRLLVMEISVIYFWMMGKLTKES